MKIDTNKLLFNTAGILIGLFAAGYAISDQFTTQKASACAARYSVSSIQPIANASGDLLTPIELQAMAGAREYGMLEHAKIIPMRGAPSPAVLEVTVPKGDGKPERGTAAPRSGIGMQWTPFDVAGAQSTCLSYSIYLPSDFDFGDGGMLPGLFGGSRFDGFEKGESKPGFAARVTWREKGVGEVSVQIPKLGDKISSIGRDKFQLARGRWISIEQELQLNTPKRPDGKLRLWIDGELRFEHDKLPWRDEASTSVEGVVGNVGFGTVERPGQAPRESKILLSPFELRWQQQVSAKK